MSNTNDIKLYNTDEIFALNPDMNINIVSADGKPILIIDDFYKNPDLVRDLAINTPIPSTNRSYASGYPGKRGLLGGFIDNKQFYEKVSDILLKSLDIHHFVKEGTILDNGGDFIVNVFDSEENISNENRFTLPHTDPSLVASVIYLNKEDEDPVGTGIYKHKSGYSFKPNNDAHLFWICKQEDDLPHNYMEGLQTVIKSIDLAEKQGNHVLDGNDEWECIARSTGAYNQFIGYVAGMFHSPLIDYNIFKDKNYKRINQVIFWDPSRRYNK